MTVNQRKIFRSINGPSPRVGDSVLCQRKQVEGYGNQTPYKHYGFDVRIVDSHSDGRRNRNKKKFIYLHRTKDGMCCFFFFFWF